MFRITRDPSSGSYIQCLVKITVMVLHYIILHYTTVILAKHCIKLPDDGSLVIRNMLKQYKIYRNNSNCIYELYICASVG